MASLARLFLWGVVGGLVLGHLAYAQGPPKTSYEAEGARAPEHPEFEPENPITLPDALAAALERNPRLTAFDWELRAADARLSGAGKRFNPELSFEVEDIRLGRGPAATSHTRTLGLNPFAVAYEREHESGAPSGFEEAEFTLAFSQTFQTAGKRGKEKEVALRAKEVAQWDYEVARANVLSDVSKAFVSLLQAQQRYILTEELIVLARQVHGIVTARVDAGKVSPIERTKSEVTLEDARLAHDQALNDFRAARFRLAALMGQEEPEFDAAAGRCGMLAPLPDIDWLRAQIAQSPEIQRWMAELEKREADVRLKKAHRVPDVTVAVGLRTTGGSDSDSSGWGLDSGRALSFSRSSADYDKGMDTSVQFEVSIPLKIFSTGGSSLREAEAYAGEAGERRRGARLNALATLRETHETLRRARLEIERLRAFSLPKSEDVFRLTQEGYEAGKFELLAVLDAQRTLFDVRYRLLNALETYHLSEVELGRIIGQPISCLSKGLRGEAEEDGPMHNAE